MALLRCRLFRRSQTLHINADGHRLRVTAGGRSAFDTPANYCFGSQRRCRHCSDVFFGGQEEEKKSQGHKVVQYRSAWKRTDTSRSRRNRGQSGRRQICSSWPETEKTGTVSKKVSTLLGSRNGCCVLCLPSAVTMIILITDRWQSSAARNR